MTVTEKEITKINVGRFSFSIVGLKQAIAALSESCSGKPDEDVQSAMLDLLAKDNYIPATARGDYGRAFVREFRKALGQPFAEEAPRVLDVKVLGAGCTQCAQLTTELMEALAELRLPASVDHVADIREIAGYGVMGLPALIVCGKVVAVGSAPPKEKIKRLLAEAAKTLGLA